MSGATSRPASLPMYDADRAAVATFWDGFARALRAEGVDDVPDPPAWPADLDAHWRDPRLLLSQACGYPLVTRLASTVQVVGAFRYDAPGCEGIDYRSALVVRDDDTGGRIEDFRGRRAGFSDPHSHSGCNALRALVAPLADERGRFFGEVAWTGSHRASLAAVLAGEVDIAAIDAVTLAGLRRHAPERVEGLRVIGHTARAPGLPLITGRATTPDELTALRRALTAACADPVLRAAREALFIGDFVSATLADWRRIDELRRIGIGSSDGIVASPADARRGPGPAG